MIAESSGEPNLRPANYQRPSSNGRVSNDADANVNFLQAEVLPRQHQIAASHNGQSLATGGVDLSYKEVKDAIPGLDLVASESQYSPAPANVSKTDTSLTHLDLLAASILPFDERWRPFTNPF